VKKKLLLFVLISSYIFGNISNTRYGPGLDIGSKGSGVFFNYLVGNNQKNLDLLCELRYFDIKGETESIVYDYWTNQYVTISGQNLILIPILVGVNYHPFAGQIANNFSPFITIRGGTNLAIDGKEGDGSYKQKWSKAKTYWSTAGFIGAGIEFRWYNQSSIALHIGSDILKLSQKADEKDDYSGLLIHISFNKFLQKDY
tara:strand:- start:7180 stop:7779 length:600 start_codon:yes stop_codon:yes gene_type:complete